MVLEQLSICTKKKKKKKASERARETSPPCFFTPDRQISLNVDKRFQCKGQNHDGSAGEYRRKSLWH